MADIELAHETKTFLDESIPSTQTSSSEKSDSSDKNCKCIKSCGRIYRQYNISTPHANRIFSCAMMVFSLYSIPLYYSLAHVGDDQNARMDPMTGKIILGTVAGILTLVGCTGLIITINDCYKASKHTESTSLI